MELEAVKYKVPFFKSSKRITPGYKIWDIYDKMKDSLSFELEYNLYRDINKDCNREVMRQILEEARPFYMPARMGILVVIGKKMDFSKKLKFNWGIYRKTKKRVYFLNEHTNFQYYRFKWFKGMVKNISTYRLEKSLKYKKMLSDLITQKKVEYPLRSKKY